MRAILCSCCCSSRRSQTPTVSFSPPTKNPNPSSLPLRSLSVSTTDTEVSAQPSAAGNSLLQRRRLILLRHAESTAPAPFLKDHDRPLSRAGRADATVVAKKLQQMGWIPELILSSDATRTKETLQIMQEHARGFSEAKAYFIPSFYSIAAMDGQTADHLQKTICEYSGDEILSVMCMGHNRGWEEAASMFSGASIELKTCNAALLEATGKSWIEDLKTRKTIGTGREFDGLYLIDDALHSTSCLSTSSALDIHYGLGYPSLQAFASAGLGGWKLHGIIKPEASS